MNDSTDNAPSPSTNKHPFPLNWPVLLAVLALVCGIVYIIFKYYTAHENALSMARSVYDYATFQIVDASGCSIWLARAVVLIAIIPLWYFSLRILARPRIYIPFYRNDPKVARSRDRALIVFAIYCALFFIVMYGATRNTNFSHQSNEVRKWINERTGQTFDSPGLDPRTGEKLIPITTELAIQMEKRTMNVVPRLLKISFIDGEPSIKMFDPVSGKPLVWFSRGDHGTLRFFDADGFDPATNEKLRPITRDIIAEARIAYTESQSQLVRKQIHAADQDWMTVMSVRSGQTLKIETEGTWISYPKAGPSDADGGKYPKKQIGGMIIETAVIGYLEGKIGNGNPFKIGKGRDKFEVPSDGELKMRMYDDPTWGAAYSDNSGSIEVIITDLSR